MVMVSAAGRSVLVRGLSGLLGLQIPYMVDRKYVKILLFYNIHKGAYINYVDS